MGTDLDAEKRVGTRVAGKYQLLRLLGAGGMGAVYEAEHSFTKRRVAVKLMHPMFARSGIAAERFLREAQAPGTIGHAGIVEVLDGGHDGDGSLYLVLELLAGETLSKALEGGRPALPWLVSVSCELLDALQAAHSAGFVHRDIKPENVFLVPSDADEPLVKLLDFGVAGVLADDSGSKKPNLTRAGAVLGTPLYMSPEQALGRRVDARSDLWAVGAILYQALTGKPPFVGGNVQGLLVSISTEQHLPLSVASPGLPLRMVKVVEKALEKDPEQRWQSAAEMAEALQQAMVAVPRSVSDDATVARRAQVDEQARLGRIAIAALLALASVAVAAFIILGPDEGGYRGPRADERGSGAPAAEPEPAASAAAAPAQPGVTAGAAANATGASTAGTTASAGATTTATGAAAASGGSGGSPASTAAATTGTAAEVKGQAGSLVPASAPPSTQNPPRGVDAAQLSAELTKHDTALQRCHQDVVVAAMVKSAQGAAVPEIGVLQHDVVLDVVLQVSASGSVSSVEVRGDAPESLRRCVADVARSFSFPRTERETEARVPILFQRSVGQQ